MLDAKLGIFRVFPVDNMMILMTDFVGKFVNDMFEKEYILKALISVLSLPSKLVPQK